MRRTPSDSVSHSGAPGGAAPTAHDRRPLRVCVIGARPATGNLGVTALNHALVTGIARRTPEPVISIFDDRPARGPTAVTVDGRSVACSIVSARATRRLLRSDSLWRIRRAGRRSDTSDPVIRALREADAVLDVTAGDSFTDLYGRRRFEAVMQEKTLALEQNGRLILLPQTIGPFRHYRTRRRAGDLLRRAAMVWTRDAESHATLRALLGAAYDPARHRAGVDMAFALDPVAPPGLSDPFAAWLGGDTRRPLVGCNVSGLILNGGRAAARRFGLRAAYEDAIVRLLARILDDSDANILLVPHVATRPGHVEHDPDACDAVARALAPHGAHRFAVAPATSDPGIAKWVIGRTDWFCSTRLHAAIASLSSGVPTAAIAYSDKARGVFETCGRAGAVADPRTLDTDALVDRLHDRWLARTDDRRALAQRLPAVLHRAGGQMDEIVAAAAGTPVATAPLGLAA